MSKMFSRPKIKTPAAAPTPAAPEAPKRELGSETPKNNEQLRKKKGRNALRIDPQLGGVNSKRTGINVPLK